MRPCFPTARRPHAMPKTGDIAGCASRCWVPRCVSGRILRRCGEPVQARCGRDSVRHAAASGWVRLRVREPDATQEAGLYPMGFALKSFGAIGSGSGDGRDPRLATGRIAR